MSHRLPPLPTVSEIVRLYKLRAQKQLSQNFLLDLNLTKKIVRCSGKLDDSFVIEVGPGPGGITRPLLESAARKIAVIEKDVRFVPGLQLLQEASDGKLDIHVDDIMRFNLQRIIPEELIQPWTEQCPKIHIIGNLPFNVSTPLIVRWLHDIAEHRGAWTAGRVKMTLTFQKEVAERMVAPILGKQRSRLSIMCNYLCKVTHCFTIPGKAFVPKPDVDIGVVHFEPLVQPVIALPFKLVEKVVRHVFHYRQKMCKRGLQTLFPPDRVDLGVEIILKAGIDPASRPFALSMEEFANLCHAYKYICDKNPGIFEYDYRSQENAKHWRKSIPALPDLSQLQAEAL